MDRIIEMSTEKGDLVFDPFGGSGTTYMAAELKGRRWFGCEIGPADDIKNRFDLIDEEREILESYRSQLNQLFPEKIKKRRLDLGLWICETFHDEKPENGSSTSKVKVSNQLDLQGFAK
jgi:site-specific DNA-methyltransferase (adenine-specific)